MELLKAEWIIASLFVLILIAGVSYLAYLEYRIYKIRKKRVEQDTKDFVAMRLYKERLNAEKARKAEVKTDPNEPEFGQGWFYYIVQRDIAELKRERGLKNNDKTS